METRKVVIGKAVPVGDQQIPSVCIVIEEPAPETEFLSESMEHWRKYLTEQGRMLEEALQASLPGGTYDQVFARMAARKATLFRVPYG